MAIEMAEYWRQVRFKQAELAGASIRNDEDGNPATADSTDVCRVILVPYKNGLYRITAIETKVLDVVIVSLKNPDGGRAGVMTEVSLESAARAIVEHRARVASPAETERYRTGVRESHEEAKREQAAAKVQVSVITQGQADTLGGKKSKS